MARRIRKNVGVIGLGIIGSRVAENLRRLGFHVFVWNRNPRPVPNFVGAPAELAAIGQATVVKLATNIVTGASVQALAEGLAIINAAGIPSEKFVEALQNNASFSKTLSMKLPKMIEGNFEPHFALKHMLKDMKIASQLGLSHHLELAVTTAARDRLLEQEQRGFAEEDFSVIARKYIAEAPLPSVDRKS